MVISPEYREEIEKCFASHSAKIRGFLRGYTTRDNDLADELVQETFLRAAGNWAALTTLNEDQRLAWLRKVAVNVAVDVFRKNATSRRDRPAVAWARRRDEDPYRDAIMTIAAQHAFAVIDDMPPRRRLMAFLKWQCGWTNGEIAAALDCTPGAVSQSLATARAVLVKELRGHVPFESGWLAAQGGERDDGSRP